MFPPSWISTPQRPGDEVGRLIKNVTYKYRTSFKFRPVNIRDGTLFFGGGMKNPEKNVCKSKRAQINCLQT